MSIAGLCSAIIAKPLVRCVR